MIARCLPAFMAALLLAGVVGAAPGMRDYPQQGMSPVVAPLSDGGIAIATVDSTLSSVRLLRLDAAGDVAWERSYPAATQAWPVSIVESPAGGIELLVGGTDRVRLLETAPDGRPVTARSLAVASPRNVNGFLLRDGGDTLYTAVITESAPFRPDRLTLQRSGSAAPAFSLTRLLAGTGWDLQAGAVGEDGQVFLGGHAGRSGAPRGDAWLTAWDESGFLWERAWTDPVGVAAVHGLAAAPGEGAYVVMVSDCHVVLLRIGPSGDVEWCRGSTGRVTQHAGLSRTPDGDAVVAAEVLDPVRGYVTWIGRFAPDGSLRWQVFARHDILRQEPIWRVSGTPGGEIVVAGSPSQVLRVVRLSSGGEIPGCLGVEPASFVFEDFPLTVATSFTTETPLSLSWTSESWTSEPLATEAMDGCPPEPPREVSPRGAAQPLVFTSRDDLLWEDGAHSGSTSFDVQRGELAWLRGGDYGRCLVRSIAGTGHRDPTPPPPSGCWFYLVVGRNFAGIGPLGYDSFREQRPHDSPCP